jgi:tetratricopeptide (TPR) repeat protein
VRKSTSLWFAAALVAAVVGIYLIGSGLDWRRYGDNVTEEMTYYPSGRLLKVADIGFDAVVADLMWLKGIQYYGEHRKTDRAYPLAAHIFSTITDLDPGFIGAYRFGALVLAEDVGSAPLAITLLRKGIRENPDAWELPFDLGFLYFIDLADYSKAAHYFRFASRIGDAPDIARRFTAFAYLKAGKIEVAQALWEEVARSTSNKIMRQVAKVALQNLDLDAAVEKLSELVERFRANRGRFPATLDDLVEAGLVKAIPPDPFGGTYFLDPRMNTVTSTTRAREVADGATAVLRLSLERFHGRTGHFPDSLLELKSGGFIDEIPIVPGAEVKYDPAGGAIRYDLLWRDKRR